MDEPTGRALGGIARANSLSKEERSKQASAAAKARWSGKVAEATHVGELKIGDLVLPCAVLEGGIRVLSERGVLRALGMTAGARDTHEKLPRYLRGQNIVNFIDPELKGKLVQPLWFRFGSGRSSGKGVPATLLPDICDVWLRARDAQALVRGQEKTARMADILMRGLAHVGIIALVDEATGYQRDRARDALASILEAFIAKELQPWVKTFPTDFYQEMFRLRGLQYPSTTVKRPQYFGLLTNNVVYDRLAPGVKDELQKGVPRNEAGRPTAKYFQKLTQNTGYPKLREHLGSVVTIMKLSRDWNDFVEKIDRIHPRYGQTLSLPLEPNETKDDGTGL